MSTERKWFPLGSGINGNVSSICYLNNELYAVGEFSVAGGVVASNIAKWNGSSWSSVTTINGNVNTCFVYSNELYIGGKFTSVGSLSATNVAKYNPTTQIWSAVGSISREVRKIKEVNNQLYLLSEYSTFASQNIANAVFKLSGSSWVSGNYDVVLGEARTADGTSGSNSTIKARDIIYFDSKIYVCQGECWALEVYQNNLYAGGRFELDFTLGGTGLIKKWTGTNWINLGDGIPLQLAGTNSPTRVFALKSYQDELGSFLYVGGIFNRLNSTNKNTGIPTTSVARWNGNVWSGLGTRDTVPQVRTLFGINLSQGDSDGDVVSGLYAGGIFSAMPDCLANGISLYTDPDNISQEDEFDPNEGASCKPIFPCNTKVKKPIPTNLPGTLIPGPQGPPGPQGAPGPAGSNGSNGENGEDCTVYGGILKTGTDPLKVADWDTQYRSLPKDESGKVDTSQLSDCDCYMDFGSSRKIYFYDGAGSFGGGAVYDTTGGGGGGDFECEDLESCCSEIQTCMPCSISSTNPADGKIDANGGSFSFTTTLHTPTDCKVTSANTTNSTLITNISVGGSNQVNYDVPKNYDNQSKTGFIKYTTSSVGSSTSEIFPVHQEPYFKKYFVMLTFAELLPDNTARWKYKAKRAIPTGDTWQIIEGTQEITNIYNIFEMLNTSTNAYGNLKIQLEGSIFILQDFTGFQLKPIPIKTEESPGFVVELNESSAGKWFSAPNPINGVCSSESNFFDNLLKQTDNIDTDF